MTNDYNIDTFNFIMPLTLLSNKYANFQQEISLDTSSGMSQILAVI